MNSKINWHKIKTSNGVASLIPEALEKLNSPIEDEREWAYWKIDNNAVLQSDLYEAAYYVIEPIVQLLEAKDCRDPYRLLQLLIEIALGQAPDEIKIIDESGISISLKKACRRKLKSFEKRIIHAQVIKNEDLEEKEYLLEIIEDFI